MKKNYYVLFFNFPVISLEISVQTAYITMTVKYAFVIDLRQILLSQHTALFSANMRETVEIV